MPYQTSKSHIYEDVTNELAQWLDEMPRTLAADIAGGKRAPFAAPLSEKEKVEYYRTTLFNEDGSPNVQARQQLLDRTGIKGYSAVMNALGKAAPGSPDHPMQAQIAADVSDLNPGAK